MEEALVEAGFLVETTVTVFGGGKLQFEKFPEGNGKPEGKEDGGSKGGTLARRIRLILGSWSLLFEPEPDCLRASGCAMASWTLRMWWGGGHPLSSSLSFHPLNVFLRSCESRNLICVR